MAIVPQSIVDCFLRLLAAKGYLYFGAQCHFESDADAVAELWHNKPQR